MAPRWLTVLAVIWLVVCVWCAGMILADIVRKRRGMMAVMKWVWPINALYMGPLGLWAYGTMGTKGMHQSHRNDVGKPAGGPKRPVWHSVFQGVTHCGAGCTPGDIIAEWIIFFAAWQITGRTLWPEFIGDYTLAYALGIVFQFFAIAPMRGLGLRDGIVAAIKADTLSPTAFEVGLFAWMALMAFVFFHPTLHPDSVVYWFMMQIGMLVGFATSFPMNWWLIKRGIKEAM
jgi:hypothetical protein